MGMRLIVLASGRGSNFEAIAEGIASKQIAPAEIVALITPNPNAEALTRAKRLGIPGIVIEEKDRKLFESQLQLLLSSLKPDYLCLAGYMRLMSPEFVATWPNRILNVHPSLLPAFKGLHAQKQALDAGVKETGCTVHFITAALDDGPILEQRSLAIQEGDTVETLSVRLLPLEHEAYRCALAKLARKSN